MKRTVIALFMLATAGGAAAAGPIYRCGSVYTQVPCEGGNLIEAADPRSAAQRAEARRVAALERQRAAELARERKAAAAAEKAAKSPAGPASAPGKKNPRAKTGPIKPESPIGAAKGG